MNCVRCLFHLPPQLQSKLNLAAMHGTFMEYGSATDRDIQYFLQTKCLRSQLQVIIEPFLFFAVFILHRIDHTGRMEFYYITTSR